MPNAQLAKKLLIKPEHTVRVINAPPGYAELIAPTGSGEDSKTDCAVVFAHNRAELASHASRAIDTLQPGGLFWVAYPKKTAAIQSDLNRDIDWGEVRSHDFEQVSLIAIDDTWSAIRFRKISGSTPPRRRSAPSPPRSERPELVVPPDLAALLAESDVASTVFGKFSYSHRKEYIDWIEQAKRPETRARRLQKAIEMLTEGKPLR